MTDGIKTVQQYSTCVHSYAVWSRQRPKENSEKIKLSDRNITAAALDGALKISPAD